MNNFKNAISKYIDEHKDDMIADLRMLVQIPSVQGETKLGMPFGENPVKVLAAALNICKSTGLFTRNIDNYVGTVDFNWGEPADLGILCHLDVVPEGNGWTYPPFDLTEADGKLYGRGAIDDKGPAIAALYAIKAVRDLNIPLEKNVRLILGTNEENGSCDLAYYKAKEELPSMLFTPDGSYPVINCEKGMLRIGIDGSVNVPNGSMIIHKINGGNVINAVPDTCSALVSGITAEQIMEVSMELNMDVAVEVYPKYNLLQIITRGKGGHASTPENSCNAITAMLALLAALNENYTEIAVLSRLYPYGETDGSSLEIACGDDVFGRLTTVLSVIEFDGFRIEAKADVRFPVGKSSEEIINTLYKTLEDNNFTMSVLLATEPHYVSDENEFIQSLLQVYEDVTGDTGYCVSIGGSTYVHDTLGGVAFGAEFIGDENNMHGADEFITVDSLLLNAKIFANAIVRICGKEQG